MQRDDVVIWLDDYLGIDRVPDYGPQGLQIEGRGVQALGARRVRELGVAFEFVDLPTGM